MSFKLPYQQQALAVLNTNGPSLMTIGSDPEVFIVDKTNEVVPAFRIAPPQPKDAKKLPSRSYDPYNDGFGLEFQTEAATCINYLTDDIHCGLWRAHKLALRENGYINLSDAMTISDISQYSAADVRLGCTPSLNAWGEPPAVPQDPYAMDFRTIGMHVHLGFLSGKKPAAAVVKNLDLLMGPLLTSLLAGLEDPRRRTVYGRAGEYRAKSYGLEWRTPSAANMHHPVLTHFLFSYSRLAAMMTTESFDMSTLVDADRVRAFVNACDPDEARKFLKENALGYKQFLGGIANGEYYDSKQRPTADEIFDFVLEGAAKFLPACSSTGEFVAAWWLNSDTMIGYAPECDCWEGEDCECDTLADYWLQHSEAPAVRIANSKELYVR